MLSFSFDTDKPSITQEETATITCSASIKYPPLTTISLVKDGVQLAMTSEEVLHFNTKDVNVNLFGGYRCIMDASGVVLQREILLKEKGITYTSKCSTLDNMTVVHVCMYDNRTYIMNNTITAGYLQLKLDTENSGQCSGSKVRTRQN